MGRTRAPESSRGQAGPARAGYCASPGTGDGRPLVADLPEALEGLSRCPPDHPSSLFAEFVNDRVRLRWVAPAPDGLGPVSYVLMRKPGGPIEHLADGTRIAEVSDVEYVDS